uniref:Ig-like domain-containing protein n=1 Tax=Cyanoderma ruficeps TaxID=181631 RepID=A0A8C3QZV0_9PASS
MPPDPPISVSAPVLHSLGVLCGVSVGPGGSLGDYPQTPSQLSQFPLSLIHDLSTLLNLRVPPVLHSLRYLQVSVSEPSPGVPQFMSIGFLDGIPFLRYDSERGRMEPLTEWMKDGAEPGYWDSQTQISKRNQHVDAWNLETLRDRYNHSRGLHTWLRVSSCDLLSDGSVRGSDRFGYNGWDFISFDLGSGRFVAADGAAEITRRRWEHEGNEVERWTNYLKHTCPEWLQKYIVYGSHSHPIPPPDVHVSGKEEHGMLILFCRAYGFYPKTIAVNWMKGDEIWDQETEWGGIVPNSDGTFHTWARIEALPEEREQYRCRVEHPGMPEPGIFAWGEAGNVEIPLPHLTIPHFPELTSGGNLTVVVAVSVIAAILILIVLTGFIIWKLQSGNTRDGVIHIAGSSPFPFLGKAESCRQSSSHCSHPPHSFCYQINFPFSNVLEKIL